MPLHPDDQRVIDLIRESGRPAFETLQPAEARDLYARAREALQPEPQDVAEVRALEAPGPGGVLRLRLYRGLGTESGVRLPVLVYFHGGGWVIGNLDTHDGVCRALANGAQCAVVSVDYRLAPEEKFPAAAEDAVAATEWIAGNAASLGLDGARIAVGGDSAGGTLAAVAALTARDRGAPGLCFQLLIYPVMQLAMTHPSHRRYTEGLPLTSAGMAWFRDHYLRDAADAADWRASPLAAADFSELPPALVFSAEYDPLCDESEDYARRLQEAGVAVVLRRYAGHVHGFLTMGRIIAASGEAITESAAALRAAFAT